MAQLVFAAKRKQKFTVRLRRELPYHLFLLPGLALLIYFCYIPMIGTVIAFQEFSVFKGWFAAKFVGLENFQFLLSMPNFKSVMWNTVYISLLKIIFSLAVPILVSLMLNEVQSRSLKRTVQTVIYMPHFLSWVVMGGIILDILSNDGVVNQVIQGMGGSLVNFLTSNKSFRSVLIVTEVWKTFGFNTIIYLAALTAIDPTLYEAAWIDGADRWQQTWHITLPGMIPTIVLVATLSLGNILNAGFDQVYMLLNTLVMDTGDILDTLVYRMAFDQAQYSIATAVGLFKSVISMALICISYGLAFKYADYRIF